jgi:hypothetical protein
MASSHELAEIATDADIGIVTVFGPPLAWYDSSCGENADICAQEAATTTVSGRTWTVQQLFSKKQNTCIATGVQPTLASTIPSSASTGTQFNFTLTARNPSGSLGTDTAFVGTIQFTSSDASAILPANYTFTAADHGSANFSATLNSTGLQTITAAETLNGAINVIGTVNVAGLPPACTYSVSPLDLSSQPKTLGAPTITVTTPAGCPVTATSFQSWVTIGTIVPNGGTTTVNLVIAANSGLARATAIVVAGRLYFVSQMPGP